MLRGIGVAFLALVGAAGIAVCSALMHSDFPVRFATGDSITVLATILALNFATATFLIGSLLNIEEKIGHDAFTKPRKEIRQNLYVMAGMLFANIILVAFINPAKQSHVFGTKMELNNLLSVFVIGILLFYIVLLLEIISGALNLRIPKD